MNSEQNRQEHQSAENLPEISLVIVTYRSADVIGACLDSVAAAGGVSREVFVVDNASSDGTAEVVRTRYPSVQLIANSENRGFAAANNQAIPLCKGRYLFFLNPDAVLDGPCLETAVRYMDENLAVGLAGTRVVYPDGAPQETISLRYPGEKHASGELAGLSGSIACVLGASMIARAELVRIIGGFDEDYFLYGEDQELCLQIRRRGYEIGYIAEATVRHIGGHSETKAAADRWGRKARAEYLFYRKHYRPETVRRIAREDRLKAWWRVLTIPLTLPFLRDGVAAREKLVKYRAILETLEETEKTGTTGGS
ncbi:MAG TPA: glycosyltransferase family 2 protein [Methanoculleus sp.]|nr:glycosyltransferase family 2 protein [Methanoculleus sp.]